MKKVFLSAALALVAAGSWAFYPKADEPEGYMMVVSNTRRGLNGGATIIVINADGSQTETEVPYKEVMNFKKLNENVIEVHKATLLTLNRYTRNGWHIVSAVPNEFSGGNPDINQILYVLEKN